MWSELLSIAPSGFIAPVASLCAAIAYESADKEGAAINALCVFIVGAG